MVLKFTILYCLSKECLINMIYKLMFYQLRFLLSNVFIKSWYVTGDLEGERGVARAVEALTEN